MNRVLEVATLSAVAYCLRLGQEIVEVVDTSDEPWFPDEEIIPEIVPLLPPGAIDFVPEIDVIAYP